MYKKDGFITPSEHVNFLAKNLFGACGQIVNGAIAYLAPDGGGPVTPHTHATDHLFIVTQGEAKVLLDGQERIIRENEAFIVKRRYSPLRMEQRTGRNRHDRHYH